MADQKTKMAIVRVEGRRETPISWATGDYYALVVSSKCAALETNPKAEYYWRPARREEMRALEKARGTGKLPGW